MSEFHVPVVQVGKVGAHPNADELDITHVYDYPVVVRRGDFKPGDLAVYVPVDAMVDTTRAEFAFLADPAKQGQPARIKAKRLRGIFSMGLLVPAPPGAELGQDLTEALGISKWEPQIPVTMAGDAEPDPGFMLKYTDIEGLRRWPDLFTEGEEVILLEKIHGCNARYTFYDGRLWVGSHNQLKKKSDSSVWWKIAEKYDLERKLAEQPGVVIYGEIYGPGIQDLLYDASVEAQFIMFDATFVQRGGVYMGWDTVTALAQSWGLPLVPVLYRGPWFDGLRVMANGSTTIAPNHHCREGFVIRPVIESWHEMIGRRILKFIGEDYLLRDSSGRKKAAAKQGRGVFESGKFQPQVAEGSI